MAHMKPTRTTPTVDARTEEDDESQTAQEETSEPAAMSPFALSVAAAKKRKQHYIMVPASDRDVKLQKREPQIRRQQSQGATTHTLTTARAEDKPPLLERTPLERTPLYVMLSEDLELPHDICDGILAALKDTLGEDYALQLAREEWFRDLANWERYKVEVLVTISATTSALAMPLVHPQTDELLFQVCRLVDQNERHTIDVNCPDEEALNRLEQEGWIMGEGQTWGENDCLADSVLQVLMASGLVGSLEEAQRRHMCAANRVCLNSVDVLMPRDIHGCIDSRAFLQHHRHVEATCLFFLEQQGDVTIIPVAGLHFSVHARLACMEDDIFVCARRGLAPGPPIQMHLYDQTGKGFHGYHCIPMFHRYIIP